MKKKILALALSLTLIAAAVVGGTFAYLSDVQSDVNVMTVGNVYIAQHEYERNGNGDLVDFTQAKPAYPAVYANSQKTMIWNEENLNFDAVGFDGECKVFDETVKNVVDKFVLVENTGKSEAYFRTVVALEHPFAADSPMIHVNYNDTQFAWEFVGLSTINGVQYYIMSATHKEALKPGEVSAPSLLQVYLDPTAGNEECEAFGDTWEILVVSQAVQTAGFENAANALKTAFGEVKADDNPWNGTNAVEFKVPAVVETAEDFADALNNGENVVLTADLVLEDNKTYSFGASKMRAAAANETVINLNGHTLTAVSTATGKNFNLFDVNGGVLTVVNGTIEYKHEGANMGWGNSTNIFNVTAGGVLNLENVTAKNLGGSDMAFVAHLNNWGEVTLNVNNCALISTYAAIRVFNSGYDMNNVTITNSTLVGDSSSFWVHNYTVEDFGTAEKAASQAKLLNMNILVAEPNAEVEAYDTANLNAEANNTFVGRIRFGFTNSVNFYHTNSTVTVKPDDIQSALNDGKDVYFSDDVSAPLAGSAIYGTPVAIIQKNGGVIDGTGNSLIIENPQYNGYAIETYGGTIKNLVIDTTVGRGIVISSPKQDIIIDNVIVDGPGYAINTTEHSAKNLIVTNSTFNGWSSLAGLADASFTNCTFGENTSKYWQGNGYGQDFDRLIRPYCDASFNSCKFEKGFYIDLSALEAGCTVTLTDCTADGVELNANNYADYITIELPSGRTLADCVVFN